jgi:hypothetical protein
MPETLGNMKKVVRYECQFCKKEFRTPGRHHCKRNPELKNCFSCKHLVGWKKSEDRIYSPGVIFPNYPHCDAGMSEDWDIEIIKSKGYDMQCESYEHGQHDGPTWLDTIRNRA